MTKREYEYHRTGSILRRTRRYFRVSGNNLRKCLAARVWVDDHGRYDLFLGCWRLADCNKLNK